MMRETVKAQSQMQILKQGSINPKKLDKSARYYGDPKQENNLQFQKPKEGPATPMLRPRGTSQLGGGAIKSSKKIPLKFEGGQVHNTKKRTHKAKKKRSKTKAARLMEDIKLELNVEKNEELKNEEVKEGEEQSEEEEFSVSGGEDENDILMDATIKRRDLTPLQRSRPQVMSKFFPQSFLQQFDLPSIPIKTPDYKAGSNIDIFRKNQLLTPKYKKNNLVTIRNATIFENQSIASFQRAESFQFEFDSSEFPDGIVEEGYIVDDTHILLAHDNYVNIKHSRWSLESLRKCNSSL